jgi:hypothetical protein
MATATKEDFEELSSAIGNLAGKIATQNDVLNNGPTSDDFQSLTRALLNKLEDKSSEEAIGATRENTKNTKNNSEEKKKNTDSNKSLISKLGDLGKNLEKFTSILNKTQKEFGVSIAGAAKLQASAITASVKSFIDSFKSINFTQIFSGLKNITGIVLRSTLDAGASVLTGNFGAAKDSALGAIDKIQNEFTKALAGPAPTLGVLPEEVLEATKFYQEEFGIINSKFGEEIAKEAKNRGLSVQQLVQARRVFATTALGDLNKVAGIQSRFFDQFAAKGLTPKIALEAISKYSELIARNGTRFAESFARAAADAKKIGIDLGKVDQIGDNIIDNFESFLEGSAEMGAMGFNFDTTRLAELAETGSTEDLFNELRSQLALTGKDITQLRRSERLGLENFLGINISDMLKMAGMTPGGATGETDPADQTNNLLAQLLVLLAASGPVIGLLGNLLGGVKTLLDTGAPIVTTLGKILTALGPTVLGTVILGALVGWAAGKMGAAIDKDVSKLTAEGKDLISRGNFTEGARKIEEAEMIRQNAIRAGTSGPMDDFVARDEALLKALKAAEEITAREKELYYKNNPSVLPNLQKLIQGGYSFSRQSQPQTMQFMPQTVPSFLQPPPVNKADGGLVTGPGTSKSDSIPARLSNGEYVLNAKAVSQLGVDYLDKLNNVPKFADGGLVGSANQLFQSRGLANLISGMNKLSSFGERFSTSVDGLTSNSGLLGKFESLKNLNIGEKINQGINGFLGKITGGLTNNLGGGIKEKAMGFASKIPGLGSLLGGKGDNVGGMIKEKAMGFASKMPGLGSLLGGGGLSGVTSKIPGLSSISNVFSGFKEGGVGGAIKSLAGAGAGKLVGGALGTLIPIPGVGTMLGSLAGGAIGKGIGKVGGAIKGLFGKKKPVDATSSMFGGGLSGIAKQKLLGNAPVTPRGRIVAQPKISQEMMQSVDPDIAMMMGQAPVQTINQPAPQVKVDTTGIEQKLNAFIAALNNIQINMDGASVGKVLVNASDAATTLGLFRPDSRATF